MSDKCSEQQFNGQHCTNPLINDKYCYWHTKIGKDDSTVKQFVKGFTTLKGAVENGNFILEKVSFSNADMNNFNLSFLNLKGAIFDNTNVAGASFYKADLTSSFFRESILTETNFTDALISKAGFTRCKITDAIFSNAALNSVKFTDCDLSGARLNNVDFSNAKLIFVNLYRADLSGARFSNYESQMKYCSLNHPDLYEYFLNLVFAWIKSNSSRDIFKVIEFFRDKLPPDDFSNWVNRIINEIKSTIKQKLEYYENDTAVNLMQTYLEAYKMLGGAAQKKLLTSNLLLDFDQNNKSYLSFKANLEKDKITAFSFNILNRDIYNLLTAYSKLDMHSKNKQDNELVKISLNSPLELVYYSISTGAIIKGLVWIIDIFKKLQEIALNSEELKKKTLETSLLELDLKKKLREEFKEAKDDDINKAAQVTVKHFLYVNKNREISEYEISDGENTHLIKKALKLIPERKNKQISESKKKKDYQKSTSKNTPENLKRKSHLASETDLDEKENESEQHKNKQLDLEYF